MNERMRYIQTILGYLVRATSAFEYGTFVPSTILGIVSVDTTLPVRCQGYTWS